MIAQIRENPGQAKAPRPPALEQPAVFHVPIIQLDLQFDCGKEFDRQGSFIGEVYFDGIVAQEQLPVTIAGAGLPQLRARMGEAKSYAERLFDFPEIGLLSPPDAREAIVRPAENEGLQIEEPAVDLVIEKTQGYPYFLQEWGKHT
jgi:hypothetical protein